MRATDIEIYKVFLTTIDATLPCPNCSEVKLDEEDALCGYIAKLCVASLSETGAVTADYGDGEYADETVPKNPEDLKAFTNVVAGRIYELVRDNTELRAGSGIFVYFLVEERPFVAMFKMPFQEMFLCRLDAEGNVSWILNSKVMPKGGLSKCEYFVIDPGTQSVRLSDTQHYIDDVRCNYLAEHVLKLRPKTSEKKTVATMREAAVEVIRECYPKEQVPEKIMDLKKEVADRAESSGCVSVACVEEAVFSDSEKAGELYRERMEKEQIPREPIAVSPKTERALTRKQKIVTDNGIEILVPVSYLRNPDFVEYVQADDGKITILLKEITSIEV